MRRASWLAAALALAGCATPLKSTLPPASAPASFVGVTGPAIPPAQLQPELARVRKELEQRLMGQGWPVPIQLAQLPDGALRVRLGADESFDPAGADLAPDALVVYAAIGDVLKAAPAMVAHVVVHNDTPAADPASDLSARRAAAVQSYFVARGIPATRVRAEGRANAEPLTPEPGASAANRRVEIVLKPVVAGQEAAAWAPPASTACETCAHD